MNGEHVILAGLVEHLKGVTNRSGKPGRVRRDDALPRRGGPAAVAQHEQVHGGLPATGVLLGQRGDARCQLFGTHAHHGVDRGEAQDLAHALRGRQALEVILVKSEGGHDAQVPEGRVVVVGIGRRAHVRAAHAKPGKEAAAQRHDHQDGEEATERAPDAAHHAFGERPHKDHPPLLAAQGLDRVASAGGGARDEARHKGEHDGDADENHRRAPR